MSQLSNCLECDAIQYASFYGIAFVMILYITTITFYNTDCFHLFVIVVIIIIMIARSIHSCQDIPVGNPLLLMVSLFLRKGHWTRILEVESLNDCDFRVSYLTHCVSILVLFCVASLLRPTQGADCLDGEEHQSNNDADFIGCSWNEGFVVTFSTCRRCSRKSHQGLQSW